MRKLVTFFLGSPILLPDRGPATSDSWLAWAHMALTRNDSQTIRPQAVDWVPTVDLPLAYDPECAVWRVSSLLFPDPGVWVANRGYRKDPNSGDITGRAAAFPTPVPVGQDPVKLKESLFSRQEASSGIYRGAIYDLSGWYTSRIQWIVEFDADQEPHVARLLTVLASVGVGRKASDGYGAVRDWTWEDTDQDPLWDDAGLLRRPIPAACVPDRPDLPRYVYALQSARWLGVPTLCAGPGPDTWHPALWTPPAIDTPNETPSRKENAAHGNQS